MKRFSLLQVAVVIIAGLTVSKTLFAMNEPHPLSKFDKANSQPESLKKEYSDSSFFSLASFWIKKILERDLKKGKKRKGLHHLKKRKWEVVCADIGSNSDSEDSEDSDIESQEL